MKRNYRSITTGSIVVAFLFLIAAGSLADTTIPVTDANVRSGLSPYSWIVKDGLLNSSICGASLNVGFKGTKQVSILVASPMTTRKDPLRIPVIAWTVNGGPLQTYEFGLDEKSFVLASGVQDPVIDLYIKGMSPSELRWRTKPYAKLLPYDPDIALNSLSILGFTVDDGGTTVAAPQPEKVWLNIGDSILSGDGALHTKEQGRMKAWATSSDAQASYKYLLAKHYGYREARLAFGGYNWNGGMAGVPKLETLIDQHADTLSRLTDELLKPAPAVTLINLGANGLTPEADIVAALNKVRSRIGKQCKLIVMVPTSGTAREVTAQALNDYRRAEKDSQAYLIDLGMTAEQRAKFVALLGPSNQAYLTEVGKFLFSTCDGLHPTAAGHRTIFETALPAFDAILKGK
jgi:hypothetical protein